MIDKMDKSDAQDLHRAIRDGNEDCIPDDVVNKLVDRFLGWKLPENFNPDGGIKFEADAAKKLNPNNARYEPSGTNLFDHQQATAMVRHMLNI